MDELAKEGLKAVVATTLKPLVKVIEDGVGALGGDALAEYRKERQERRRNRHEELGQRTIKLLQNRNIGAVSEPTETTVEEILAAAQDENREELKRVWAGLLAAALDPARAKYFRHEFLDIAKKLEPLDALVLPKLQDGGQFDPTRADFLASHLQRPKDQIELSFRNLRRLELVTASSPHLEAKSFPQLEPLGRQFLAAIAD